MNLYFIQGGIGKNISFTSTLNSFKEQICISTGFPNVFKEHPKVAATYPFLNWMEVEKNKKILSSMNQIIDIDPYKTDFLSGEKHINQSFFEILNLEASSSKFKNNEIYFSKEEEEFLLPIIKQLGSYVMIQLIGSDVNLDENIEYSSMNSRALKKKQIQEIINILNFDMKMNVVNVSDGKNKYTNTANIEFPIDYRKYMILLKYSQSFIAIDSFLQHASANKLALKRGLVLWGPTDSKMFGYDHNINLKSEVPYFMNFKTQNILDNFKKIDNT